MRSIMQRRGWIIVGLLIAAITLAIAWLNPKLTRWIESDRFRVQLESETAKGLHFSIGNYGAIRRTGVWTAESDGFRGRDGRKALAQLEAHGIRASFNPWGVLLKRWQLDDVHIDSAEVGIQTYVPQPEPTPAKPWFHVFLPDRVYLKEVRSQPVDVTWSFRGKKSGFFGTQLLITPHGRDFDYQARGGLFKMPPIPELRLEQTHVLITKTLLRLYYLDLRSKDDAPGKIHVDGRAGIGSDKSVEVTADAERIPIDDWLPEGWRQHVTGFTTSKISWHGVNPKLETSIGKAALRIENGRIYELPFLEQLAKLTGENEMRNLRLNAFSLDLDWRYPSAEIKNLVIENKGKFRAEGDLTIRNRALGGTIQLGVAPRLLTWLPKPEEVFSRQRDDHLSEPFCRFAHRRT